MIVSKIVESIFDQMPVRLLAFLMLFICLPAGAADPSMIRALAMVVLEQPRLPPAEVFRKNLEARLNQLPAIDAMEADGDKVILLRMGGHRDGGSG